MKGAGFDGLGKNFFIRLFSDFVFALKQRFGMKAAYCAERKTVSNEPETTEGNHSNGGMTAFRRGMDRETRPEIHEKALKVCASQGF